MNGLVRTVKVGAVRGFDVSAAEKQGEKSSEEYAGRRHEAPGGWHCAPAFWSAVGEG